MTLSSASGTRTGADVALIPPPVYFAFPLLAGLLLHSAVPWAIGGRPATLFVGVALVASGIVFVLTAVASVHRAGTTIVPHHPVSVLLTHGPYALSRNPMYTGLATAVTGAAFIVGTWWPLLLLPAGIAAVRLLVIAPEERYLASFDGYAAYRSKVRRWI